MTFESSERTLWSKKWFMYQWSRVQKNPSVLGRYYKGIIWKREKSEGRQEDSRVGVARPRNCPLAAYVSFFGVAHPLLHGSVSASPLGVDISSEYCLFITVFKLKCYRHWMYYLKDELFQNRLKLCPNLVPKDGHKRQKNVLW